MDYKSSLRRKSRKFRSAFRELQQSGYYHGSNHGIDLLQESEQGNFLIHDGNGDKCVCVLQVSNGSWDNLLLPPPLGWYKATIPIGIVFDIDNEIFHLDESCLDSEESIPTFETICGLVNYYRDRQEERFIQLNRPFAEGIWRLDYGDEGDVYKRYEEKFLIENHGEIDIELGQELIELCYISLCDPIFKKDK